MKTKIFILATVAIFSALLGFAGATNIPKMNISQVGDKEAKLSFQSTSPTKFELTVTDENNSVVFFHKSKKKHTDYHGKIDFSELGNGTYCICMNYGNQSLNDKIFVSNKNIQTGTVVHLYEPYMSFDKNKLNFSFLNTVQKQVFLNIYKDGEHVNGFNLGKEFAMQKRFDISNLKRGEYRIVVTDDFKDHIFTLRK